MRSLEMDVGQELASQRGPPYRSGSDEATRERLSSLIREKHLRPGPNWVLLADLSTDRLVILQGIDERCLLYACNDEFKLVAGGNPASEDAYMAIWPGAQDLAAVVLKIMRKKINAANYLDIVQECALRGLLICHLDANEAQFFCPPCMLMGLELKMQSLESEMEMLSRVLKPPSVLAAAGASRSLLAQGPLDTAASFSAPWAVVVSFGMDSNPSEAAGYERQGLAMYPSSSGTRSLHNLLPQEQRLAVAPPHFITSSSGGRGRNGGGGGPFDFIELWVQPTREYDLRSQERPESFLADYDLEAGGSRQAHRVGGGAAAPVQQPPEASQRLDAVMVQALAAFLPAGMTSYPLLKDSADHIKFIIFGGLAFTTLVLFVGILSNSVARRVLAIRLVCFSAIAVLTFCVASQLSSRIYIALTALVGVVLNLIIMLLRF